MRTALRWLAFGGVVAALVAGLIPVVDTAAQADIVWHGYTLNRMYQPQGGPTRFRTDRISLSAAAQIDPKLSAYVEFYYHAWVPAVSAAEPGRTYLESAYTDFKMGTGTLRVGKGRRQTFAITPSYPNRKTTNYGIFSEAFTQDRAQGIQYFINDSSYEAGIAVMTGMRIGNRGIGDITLDGTNVVKNLADRDVPHDLNESLQVEGKYGVILKNGAKFGLTGSLGRLDQSDVDFLNTEFTGSTHTSKTHNRLGAYFIYPVGVYSLQGEYIRADTSDIDHNGWEVTAAYQPKGMKPKAFARYAGINVDVPATANQYTWDKRQVSLSVVQPLRPTVWLQLEHEINMESPPVGVAKVKNNLTFLELFTGF